MDGHLEQECMSRWLGNITFLSSPNKGDILQNNNARIISEISYKSKVLLNIIEGRINTKIDEEINEIQAGFTPGMGTRNFSFFKN